MKSGRAIMFALAVVSIPAARAGEPSAVSPAPVASSGSVIGPALYVADMNRSLKFYRDVLGMTVKMQFGPAEGPDVVLGFGADRRQLGLMLLSDRAGPVPRKIEHGHGYDRFALNVVDLPAIQRKLHAGGFEASEIRKVHGAILMMMATDPDGYKVELIESGQGG